MSCLTAIRKKIKSNSLSHPLASKSYIEKAHFSFCSNEPRLVTLSAHMNSRKSILPSEFASNVRKTCSANLAASPYGKKLPYIFLNSSTVNVPSGQSLRNPKNKLCKELKPDQALPLTPDPQTSTGQLINMYSRRSGRSNLQDAFTLGNKI